MVGPIGTTFSAIMSRNFQIRNLNTGNGFPALYINNIPAPHEMKK